LFASPQAAKIVDAMQQSTQQQQEDTALAAEGVQVYDIQALTIRAQELSQSVDRWNTAMVWALVFTALAAIAVVVTTRIVLTKAKQLAQTQDALIRAKDQKLALDLRDKDLKISEASLEAASATEKAEKERLARLELEKQVAPRRLTGTQKTTMADLLKGNSAAIVVVSAIVDAESSDLADDFDTAFKESHWQTLRIKNRITEDRGVSLGTVGGINTIFVKRVSDALTAIGVPHEDVSFSADDHSISPWFQPGVLYLVVNHKPEVVTGPRKDLR